MRSIYPEPCSASSKRSTRGADGGTRGRLPPGEKNLRGRTARRATGFAPPLSTFGGERRPGDGLTAGVQRRTIYPQRDAQTKWLKAQDVVGSCESPPTFCVSPLTRSRGLAILRTLRPRGGS